VRSVGVHGRVGHVAVDPSGLHLYIATYPSTGFVNGFVSERDARTGAFVARGAQSLGYPANGLTPTARGVWVASATGNFGGAFLFREGTLDRTKRTIEGL